MNVQVILSDNLDKLTTETSCEEKSVKKVLRLCKKVKWLLKYKKSYCTISGARDNFLCGLYQQNPFKNKGNVKKKIHLVGGEER